MSGGWTPSYTLTSEWKLTPYPPQLSAKDVPAAFLRINNYSLIIINYSGSSDYTNRPKLFSISFDYELRER